MEIVSIAGQGHLWSFLVLVLGIIALPGADMAFAVIRAFWGVNRMVKCFDFEFINVIFS